MQPDLALLVTWTLTLTPLPSFAPVPPWQELEAGLLFPRFRTIKDVSARLAAAVADFMVARGLGHVPADFDKVVARMGAAGAVTNLARWEAYVRAHMYSPETPMAQGKL